jgi:Tfp pilus assembly protein PilV
MSSSHRTSGFSLAETLVALSLIAVTSAAMLPAIVAAGQLQRESAHVTDAVRIASARLDALLPTASTGAAGGALGASLHGWSAMVDRAGAEVAVERAVYDCRWTVAVDGVAIVAVRVTARGGPGDVTLSTAVRRE